MGFTMKGDVLLRYTEEPGVTIAVIPDGVRRIDRGAFENCENLVGVSFPDSVKEIGWNAFKNCKSLVSVTIPEGVTKLEGTFDGCRSLTTVSLPDSLTEIGSNAFSFCLKLQSVRIPPHVTSIGNDAFGVCHGLTSVVIPDSVKEIGRRAFKVCISLSSVTIPDTVERIGEEAFDMTPWLNQQEEEFVIVGNHILIRYNGRCEAAYIPDSVLWINADAVKGLSKIIYRGITLEDVTGTVNDIEIMLGMVMKGAYDADTIWRLRWSMGDMYDGYGVPESTVYPILWQLFPLFPEEQELIWHVECYLTEMMQFHIERGNTTAVEAVCKNGTLLTADNIDGFILYANEQGQHEVQLLLMNYKKEHIGYDTDKLTL